MSNEIYANYGVIISRMNDCINFALKEGLLLNSFLKKSSNQVSCWPICKRNNKR